MPGNQKPSPSAKHTQNARPAQRSAQKSASWRVSGNRGQDKALPLTRAIYIAPAARLWGSADHAGAE